MNWDAIGAVAEVFGAAAVLVTLIYLSLQIRQSNSLAEAQSQRELLTLDTFAPLVADPTLAAEFRACLNRYEEQDPEVKTRFWFLVGNFHLQMESVFRMKQKGLIAELSYKRLADVVHRPNQYPWRCCVVDRKFGHLRTRFGGST
ncbi:hypothetical protein ACFL3Y_02045 [Pseudomonadota bacterium]